MAGFNLDLNENFRPTVVFGFSGWHNRVFQDKTVIQIIETVFADCADVATWQWADEVGGFLADI